MKLSILSRLLVLLLALVTVLTLAACNNGNGDSESPTDSGANNAPGGPGNEDDSDGESEDDGSTLVLPDKKYGNTAFIIYGRPSGVNKEEVFVDVKVNTTPTNLEKKVYERNSLVEELLGVVIEYVDQSDLGKAVDTLTNSGKDTADLVVDHGRSTFKNVQKGVMLEWSNLPYVDVTAEWWNQDAYDQWTTPGGKLYCMTGDISYMSVGNAMCTFFNKELLEDVGLDSPYDLVRENQWTLAKLAEYAVSLHGNMNGDNTGNIETDCFGYISGHWRGPMQILYSTGTRIVEKDGDGGLKITAKSDIAVDALFDYCDLVYESDCAYVKHADGYTDLQAAFVGDRAAFYDGIVHNASVFKTTEVVFGVLPFPKYTEDVGEFGYYPSLGNADTNLFSVHKNTSTENAERISAVLEAMAYYGYEDVVPFYFDELLSYNYLKDIDSVEMLGYIRRGLTFDFGYYFFATGDICDAGRLAVKENRSLINVVDRLSNAAGIKLADWVKLDQE